MALDMHVIKKKHNFSDSSIYTSSCSLFNYVIRNASHNQKFSIVEYNNLSIRLFKKVYQQVQIINSNPNESLWLDRAIAKTTIYTQFQRTPYSR